jgi:hypothetical protein
MSPLYSFFWPFSAFCLLQVIFLSQLIADILENSSLRCSRMSLMCDIVLLDVYLGLIMLQNINIYININSKTIGEILCKQLKI